MCKGCPFNLGSDESEYAQTVGCLPCPTEIMEQHQAHRKNWACHETKQLCSGFVGYSIIKNVPFKMDAGLFFEVGVHGNIPYNLNRDYDIQQSNQE